MWGKRMAAGFIVVLALLVCSQISFAEEKAPAKKRVLTEKASKAPSQNSSQTAKMRAPRDLVALLESASIEELQKLSYTELNILKNAVFASRGYVFADDRPWLNLFFCGNAYFSRHKRLFQKLVRFAAVEINQFTGDAYEGFLRDQVGEAFRTSTWDLREYAFPPCKDSGPLDEHQQKAIANLHVAVLKKIESSGSTEAIDSALMRDMSGRKCGYYSSIILGKVLRSEVLDAFEISLRRDLHGYYRLMKLIKHVKDFDSMELLGLYAGDIIFLKNMLEAQQGKPFSGVLGWEISQIIGVTEKRPDYDPQQLPQAIQEKLKSLDDIVGKIMRSDLNDIPASLKSRPIEFINPYDLEGC